MNSILNYLQMENVGEMEEEAASIDALNEDCILMIFDHLPEDDILALTLVSKRFNETANRTFGLRIANRRITIQQLPSLTLDRFGHCIQTLKINFDADEQTVKDVCVLCPNLKKLTFDGVFMAALSQPCFRQTLPRLEEFTVKKLLLRESEVVSFTSAEEALRLCANLKRLTLGNHSNLNLHPFLSVQFPQLHEFKIRLTESSLNESLPHFFQANPTLKSIIVRSYIADVDLSAITGLQLEKLDILWDSESDTTHPKMDSVVSKLCRLTHLKELTMCTIFNEDLVRPFFASFVHLQRLTWVYLNMRSTFASLESRTDFSNADLLRIKHLAHLEDFRFIHSHRSNVTLPGILEAIQHCPKLVVFYISGFCQPLVANTGVLADEQVYDKLCSIQYQKAEWGQEFASNFVIEENDNGRWYPSMYCCENQLGLFSSIDVGISSLPEDRKLKRETRVRLVFDVV